MTEQDSNTFSVETRLRASVALAASLRQTALQAIRSRQTSW